MKTKEKTIMVNDDGREIVVPTGFSYTYLFFGWLVPVLRGDSSWPLFFSPYLLMTTFTLSGIITPSIVLTYICIHILLASTYNKLFLTHLIQRGYR